MFYLVDIITATETGDSPFPFENQAGLLSTGGETVNKDSVVGSSASFDPTTPYIILPRPSVEAIASKLPVVYDNDTHFYLWDTRDPQFERIVTPPVYVGFIFNSIFGLSNSVTIKVPFALLNLTLQPGVSGTKMRASTNPWVMYALAGICAVEVRSMSPTAPPSTAKSYRPRTTLSSVACGNPPVYGMSQAP